MARSGFAFKPRKPIRKPIRKAGKKVREWNGTRAKLNQAFLRAGITRCEVQLPGVCWGDAHGHAHKKKRRNLTPGELKETCLACNPCHMVLESKPEAEMSAIIQCIIDARETPVDI